MSGNQERNNPSKAGKIDCGDLGDTSKSLPLRNITHPLRYYEFTRDEIKVLEECDKESFYRRCLPFSTLFATATYAAIKYGFLKPNPELGAFPKVLIAALFGHFYGRYHFIPLCEERLRELPPDSHLGKVMRDQYTERMKKLEGNPK